jgi:hypothetical protein
VLWYGVLFGYWLHDDDVLAYGGHFYLFMVVYLGMLWFILLLLEFGKTFYLLLSFLCSKFKVI